MSTPNIVITGFMGTGKTTVGKILSQKVSWSFIDMDQAICEHYGVTIAEIFHKWGEPTFRSYEHHICQKISMLSNIIIATGGGTCTIPENIKYLQKNGIIICLFATPSTIQRRLCFSYDRPLFRDGVWKKLLDMRMPVYNSFGHHVHTDEKTPGQVADEILEIYQQNIHV